MAVASLVLGIVSLVFILLPIGSALLAFPLSIVGLVLAVIARKKQPSGMATAGLVLNIIALVLSALVAVACGACLGTAGIAACAGSSL